MSSYGTVGEIPAELSYSSYEASSGASTGAAAKRLLARDALHRGMPSLLAICVAFLVPCIVFIGVCASASFGVANSGLVANLGLVLLLLLSAYYGWRAWTQRAQRRGPAWHLFLLATTTVTWIAAMAVGRHNYATIQPYFYMETMSTYVDIDPARVSGQQLMDAGRILFAPGARVDASRSMGFRSSSMYCVAPVVSGNSSAEPASYDYWAVGVGCCSGQQADFHCGEADLGAGAGTRLLDDGQRPYYRLAVQQAEATYGITARHPVFVRWTRDPIAEVNAHREQACHQLIVAVCSFGVFQLFLVAAATLYFAKARLDA